MKRMNNSESDLALQFLFIVLYVIVFVGAIALMAHVAVPVHPLVAH